MSSAAARPVIRTPDQRLRVFVSSTLQELADERAAAQEAITRLRLAPVLFELGARPHPPRDLYRAYLDQSHIFVGIYWQRYGWIAPGETISGLEDEYRLSGQRPKLIYIKKLPEPVAGHPAPDREPRLKELLERIRGEDTASYRAFSSAEELRELLENDLALLLTERFESTHTPEIDAAEVRRGNLPVPPTPLVGREDEVEAARNWLLAEGANLLTFTGPGGSGKTRLALQVALEVKDQFRDGAFFVALASIGDPDLVVPTIAATLGIRESTGSQQLLDSLKQYLEDKHVLILLDNFEQVLGAASLVVELLEACPWLKVLVTSRSPLHVRGERQFPVPPLALPLHVASKIGGDQKGDVSQPAAIELFIQRARAVKPDFAITAETTLAVAEICYQLDGLPLAIELAAARVRILSPQTLLARLKSRLDVLTGGARDLPARQQTLRNALDWSYNLLNDEARILFRRLSVFAGGWTLDAAEAACNAAGDLGADVLDEIEALVDNSLSTRMGDIAGEPRFGMLRTIREYAHERLVDSGEENVLRSRHADTFLALAEEAAPHLHGAQRLNWLARLELEHDNLRAALAWSHANLTAEIEVRLADALVWFWYFAGHISEARAHLERALSQTSSADRTWARAAALFGAGASAAVQGDYVVAHERLTESVAIFRELGDRRRCAYSLLFLALATASLGDPQSSLNLLRQSLELLRDVQDRWGEAFALSNFGDTILGPGDIDTTRAVLEEGLRLWREVGDTWGIGHHLVSVSSLAWYDRDYPTAYARCQEAVDLLRLHNDKWGLARGLIRLGMAVLHLGDAHQARMHFAEGMALWQEIGNARGILSTLVGLAGVVAKIGQPERATRIFGAVHALARQPGVFQLGFDRIRHERTLALARDQLDESAWAAEFAAGQSMSMDQAVAYALEDVSESQPILLPRAPAPERESAIWLQQYIPKQLLAKLEAVRAGRALEAERRIVTMLFCDLKGSTALAESLDPEDWADIMNGAFEYLIKPIYRYEGTLARLMGDAILAFFGAPVAHEDDPQRAVRAALDIVEGMRAYREQIRQARGLDFDVRVGINTGSVVVGQIGSDLRVEYTAMGDAINLAARMEQTAQPGSVQITDNTYKLVAPLVDVEALGSIEVKGKRERVLAYRVVGLKARPGRLRGISAALGQSAPLIGRSREMSLLRQAVSDARQGRGRIACLVGEAGLGKTRLIEELRAEWIASDQPGYWGEEHSVAYVAAQPYGQFRQHLYSIGGIAETDPPRVMRDKLDRMLDQFTMPGPSLAGPGLRARAQSVYEVLLGIEVHPEQGRIPSLEGDAFKRELFDVVLSLERAWLAGGPAALVFDDLHWIDSASMELIAHLFRLTDELPILFLCAFRPDRDMPSWQLKHIADTEYAHRYSEIVLQPLSKDDSHTLVDSLITGADTPPGLLEQILSRAEGNPLFIEEVVHALIDSRAARPAGDAPQPTPEAPADIALPDTLQALFLARIDRLGDDARRVLQVAAVIGRSFHYRVLKTICDTAIELDTQLATLHRVGLIREAARAPEVEWSFRHALMQEAVYSSLLHKRRRELHCRVGEALEQVFADRLEDHAPLLAHHFAEAGDTQARRYYRLAGDNAARLYANAEAASYYTQALVVTGGALPEERIAIREARAHVCFLLGRIEEAATDYESALNLARETGRALDECRVMADLAWLKWKSGNGVEGLDLARRAEAKAQALGDRALALRASIVVGTAIQNEGYVWEAHARMRQALFASRTGDERWLTAMCWYYLAMQNNFMGRWGRAAACARQAHALSLPLGDRDSACGAQYYLSLAEGGRGNYDAALEALEAGRQLAEEIHSPWWLARYFNQRAWLSAELGDWETAYETDRAGLEPARAASGLREFEISTLINLVLDCTELGWLDEAEAYLAESQKDLGRADFGVHNWRWQTRLADARARLFIARSEPAEAAHAVAELLDWAELTRARKYVSRGRLLRGEVHTARKDWPAAEADLIAARDLADAIGYLPVRLQARIELSWLHERSGAVESAGRSHAEALQLVAAVERQLQHADLRRSFERGLARAVGRRGV